MIQLSQKDYVAIFPPGIQSLPLISNENDLNYAVTLIVVTVVIMVILPLMTCPDEGLEINLLPK